jgi:hypothetical protein
MQLGKAGSSDVDKLRGLVDVRARLPGREREDKRERERADGSVDAARAPQSHGPRGRRERERGEENERVWSLESEVPALQGVIDVIGAEGLRIVGTPKLKKKKHKTQAIFNC